MSAGLRNSTIERFRKRYHGNNVLRGLRMSQDGDGLEEVCQIEKGFYLGNSIETRTGQQEYRLTIDLIHSSDITEAILQRVSIFDLLNPVTDVFRRYKVDTNTAPITDEWRYVLSLLTDFDNKKVIV